MITKKEYSNEDVTVVWQPRLCIHSAKCVDGLSKVFDPNRKPWIDVNQATGEAIVKQVQMCPSGALSIKESQTSASIAESVKVQLMPGGPLIIKGHCEVVDEDGNKQTKQSVAFCRCNKSGNFPYCDGSHKN